MEAVASVCAVVPKSASTAAHRGAGKSHALMAQVNARIEASVKAEADAAFAHAGLAPSEVIRALYARAARLGSSLRSVDDLVVGASEDSEARNARVAAFDRSAHAFDDVLGRYGFSVDVTGFAPMSEAEVEEAIFQDYLAEGAR